VRVGAVYDSNVGGVKFSACSDAATAADQVTCFSQSSPVLSLLAPGATITAAGISMSGTSQAAPHVAGAIAVLRGTNAAPNDTLDGTIRRLQATGVRVTDARNGVTTPRIDLLKALQTLGQPAP
jgi:subtilisin family serine protease